MRGMGVVSKRKKIYEQMRDINADIIMLQETHNCDKTRELWQNEWRFGWYNSFGESNARGVSTLFNKRISSAMRNVEIRKDICGRLLVVSFELEDKKIVTCNVYGPNSDNPAFFEEMINHIKNLDFDHLIIGGDFNFVLDNEMDAYQRLSSHHRSRETIVKLMEEARLSDIWRELNPDKKKYTWKKSKPRLLCSRLDWFLINSETSTCVESCDITPAINTDHSLISIVIRLDNQVRGPGTWRLNTLHLNDRVFKEEITKVIEATKQTTTLLNPEERWEFIKGQVIDYCQKYAKRKAKKANKRKIELNTMLNTLHEDLPLAQPQHQEQVMEAIKHIEQEMDATLQQKINSSAFRSRVRFAQEGEKCSKYFLNMEKRNYFSKNIRSLCTEDGNTITEQGSILKEQRKFYKVLYTKDPLVHFNLELTADETLLNPSQIADLDAPLTLEEMHSALTSMKNNKCPGLDGLPKEFYLQHFDQIGPLLYDLYKFCLEQKQLNPLARRGLISLIPKRGKNNKLLASYRPLTLLCIDYKILSKVMAERIKKVLPSIICDEQVGFMAGRNASEIIRTTYEVVKYTKKNKIPAAIMNIDFAKCFDRISHSALEGSLRYFGFPESYIQWVMLFFTNLQIFTQNFGFLSSPFTKGRGSNQGCNISPFCYLLCGEIMARKLKQDQGIRGLTICNTKLLLSQFADDTTLYLSYDELTFKRVLETLAHIETNTCLTISYDKTVVYRIGSIAGSNAKIYTIKQLNWTNEPVNMLGVILNNDYESTADFEVTIQKMKGTLENWFNRTLTLFGKIVIVNTLCESLFVYKMSVLPNLTEEDAIRIDSMISKYLWGTGRARIAKDTLKAHKKSGGMRLFSVNSKQASLKIAWVPVVVRNDFFLRCFLDNINIDKAVTEFLFETNICKKDAVKMCNPKEFWGQVWIAWCDYNYKPMTADGLGKQTLWYNSNIKIGGRTLLNHNSLRLGIVYVKDLLNSDGVLTHDWHRLGMTWMQLKAIRKTLYRFIKNVTATELSTSNLHRLVSTDRVSNKVYIDLIDQGDTIVTKYAARWAQDLGIIDLEEYQKCFLQLYKITSITKFRSFQYRLLLNKIPTNIQLKLWGKVESKMCTFCKSNPECLSHLFLECKFVKRIWKFLEKYIGLTVAGIQMVVFNNFHTSAGHVSNFIALVFKQYIYCKKCQISLPSITEFQHVLRNWYQIERYVAKKQYKLEKFDKKWGGGGGA